MELIKRTLYDQLCIIAIGLLAGASQAGTTAFVVENDQLYTLDLATAQTEFVASIDRQFVFDIALSDSGRLFAQRDASDGFFEIDPMSGQGSGDIDLDNSVRSIGFRNESIFGQDTDTRRFVEIDPATGQLSTIAPVATSFLAEEIAFVSETSLFATDTSFIPGTGSQNTLYSIDLAGGGASEIGVMDVDGVVRGIQHVNGTLFAVTNSGFLYSIDQATASSTLIGDTGLGVDAFAAVPAPGSALSVVFIGLFCARRRR